MVIDSKPVSEREESRRFTDLRLENPVASFIERGILGGRGSEVEDDLR